MQRRVISWLLLCLIVMTMGSYYPYLRIQQMGIRRSVKMRIKQGVPDEQLHVIRLNEATRQKIRWIRPHREFVLDGMMYDVVKTDTLGPTIRLHCITDEQEKALFSKLDEVAEREAHNGNSSHHRKRVQMLKLLTGLLYLENQVPAIASPLFNKVEYADAGFSYKYLFSASVMHPPSC